MPAAVVDQAAVWIGDGYIVCLQAGKKLKMLKRHLSVKWGLRPDYPMVAPNYAAKRQELVKRIGLGAAAEERAAPRQSRRSPRKAKVA
jgi:predicted transcriptional regulator